MLSNVFRTELDHYRVERVRLVKQYLRNLRIAKKNIQKAYKIINKKMLGDFGRVTISVCTAQNCIAEYIVSCDCGTPIVQFMHVVRYQSMIHYDYKKMSNEFLKDAIDVLSKIQKDEIILAWFNQFK